MCRMVLIILILQMLLIITLSAAGPLVDPFTGMPIKVAVEKKVVVLITGSNSGIGKDTVLEFAKNPRFKIYGKFEALSLYCWYLILCGVMH